MVEYELEIEEEGNNHQHNVRPYKKALSFPFYFNIFNLCSSYSIFHSELRKLKQIFIKTEFPDTLFDKCASSFLDKSFSSAPKIPIAPKFLIYFSLPYTGSHGLQIRIQTIIIRLSLNFITLRLSPLCSPWLFFPVKDGIPDGLKSHVVYS